MRSDQVGVYVEAVDAGSAAEQAGFKIGMVLMEADGQPIAEVAKWKSIVLNAKEAQQDGIVVYVRHKDGHESNMYLPLYDAGPAADSLANVNYLSEDRTSFGVNIE